MRKFNGLKMACATLALLAATAITLPAQTFTTLYSFDGTGGYGLWAPLVQATDGNLYGTTAVSGAEGLDGGSVFKITADGTLTVLYNFCSQSNCTDGAGPDAGVVEARDGNFYGTTLIGGANDSGTVFRITPAGTLTTLYSFCSQTNCTDGSWPYAGLIQAIDGDLYGTTYVDGANGAGGTVFKITPGGTLTTLYSFCSQAGCADGDAPLAGLIQATDGNFYGTTVDGGADGTGGTVFKITPGGALTTLYNFCSLNSRIACADGAQPSAGLIQAIDGNFYGTTTIGGGNSSHNREEYGTVFKITPSGTLTTLYSFCAQEDCTDGSTPRGALVQGTDGNFYGTTNAYDGNQGHGTIFKIAPGGKFTTLYSFCSQGGYACTDGADPIAGMVQDTNGTFYGTTWTGGANGYGTVFSLSMGLGPFLETRPTLGPVGIPVKILGTNLTGATSVTFNGTPAVFRVFSSSLIGATVPTGATSGKVHVVTPSSALSSNVPFRVRH